MIEDNLFLGFLSRGPYCVLLSIDARSRLAASCSADDRELRSRRPSAMSQQVQVVPWFPRPLRPVLPSWRSESATADQRRVGIWILERQVWYVVSKDSSTRRISLTFDDHISDTGRCSCRIAGNTRVTACRVNVHSRQGYRHFIVLESDAAARRLNEGQTIFKQNYFGRGIPFHNRLQANIGLLFYDFARKRSQKSRCNLPSRVRVGLQGNRIDNIHHRLFLHTWRAIVHLTVLLHLHFLVVRCNGGWNISGVYVHLRDLVVHRVHMLVLSCGVGLLGDRH